MLLQLTKLLATKYRHSMLELWGGGGVSVKKQR